MPSSVFVGGIRISVRTMSGVRALDGGAQLVEVARHLDELDVLDVVEDADDPLPGEEAVLGGDDADRHLARA